jgi:hypothetical protein
VVCLCLCLWWVVASVGSLVGEVCVVGVGACVMCLCLCLWWVVASVGRGVVGVVGVVGLLF